MDTNRIAASARVGTPGRFAPWVGRALRWGVRPLVRVYFRASLDGIANLPEKGPFIIVANHSGGVALAEILSLAALLEPHVSEARPLAGFAHPLGFHLWPTGPFLRLVGAVPSSYDAANAALAAGVSLLIFPGGDHEATRPVWKGNTVDFGGRLGFLRIARKAGVPIVPMGIRGSHFTAPILWCSSTLMPTLLFPMRILRLKRYPLSVLGVAGVIAIALTLPWAWTWKVGLAWLWLLTVAPPLIPWVPWKVRMRVGVPIEASELFAGAEDDEGLQRSLAHVEREVRALIAR